MTFFNYFHQHRSQYHKGQLAPFFIVLIVVLIIAALVTVNIGKIARTKTYSGNSTDAGALAAASTLAYALNYVATANEKMEGNYENFNEEAGKHFTNAWAHLSMAQTYITFAMITAYKWPSRTARFLVSPAQDEVDDFVDEMDLLRDEEVDSSTNMPKGIVPHYHKFQQDYYEFIRGKVHDDGDNSNDLYTNALVAGYKFNLLNSGIAVKKGEQGQSDFQSYVDGITISNVTNNGEKSYSWQDGQGRDHEVTAKIKIDNLRNYRISKTSSKYQPVISQLRSISSIGESVSTILEVVYYLLIIGQYLKDCCEERGNKYCCIAWYAVYAICMMLLYYSYYLNSANMASSEAVWQGLQTDTSTFTSVLKEDTEPYIICWINAIEHNRLVEAYNEQEHEGKTYEAGEGTGELWEVSYPEIESSTKATFNYENRGTIYPPSALHDSAITEVDF